MISKEKKVVSFSIKWFSFQILTSSYILTYYRIVRPSLFYRMPTNIDALCEMPAHGSKKVKWYSTGSGIHEIAIFFY